MRMKLYGLQALKAGSPHRSFAAEGLGTQEGIECAVRRPGAVCSNHVVGCYKYRGGPTAPIAATTSSPGEPCSGAASVATFPASGEARLFVFASFICLGRGAASLGVELCTARVCMLHSPAAGGPCNLRRSGAGQPSL